MTDELGQCVGSYEPCTEIHGSELFMNMDSVDGFRNPKQPPELYKTLVNPGVNYQPELVQDFFHQKYEPCRDKCIGVFG